MAANIRFHAENIIDDASSTDKSTESASYPATNVENTSRTETWRTTGGTSEWRSWDYGSEEGYADGIAIINHNLDIGTFQILASNESDFSVLLLDETFDAHEEIFGFGDGRFGDHGFGGYLTADENSRWAPDFTRVYYFTAGGINARYWKLVITEPVATSLSYIEIGRIILGPDFEPDNNLSFGSRIVPVDESEVSYSEGGQPLVDRHPKRRKLEILIPDVSLDDTYFNMFDLLYYYGKRNDILIVGFPEGDPAQKYFWTVYGRFEDVPGIELTGPVQNSIPDTINFVESL